MLNRQLKLDQYNLVHLIRSLGIRLVGWLVLVDPTPLAEVRDVRYPFSAVELNVASPFSQHLSHIRVCPQIRNRELCFDFGAVEYM